MRDPMEYKAASELWRAVLCAAIRDALSPKARRSETSWIGSKSARIVCEYANVDHRRLMIELAPRLALVAAGKFDESVAGLDDITGRRRAARLRGDALIAARAAR